LQTYHSTGRRQSEHIAEQHGDAPDIQAAVVDGTQARIGGRLRFENAIMIWLTCDDANVLNERLGAR